jgi:formate/nitrite transporter FocA (FNT family)
MFVIPTGKFFGAPVSLSQWWVWNQIPVTLGNIVSGALLTGVALYVTYKPREHPARTIPVPLPQQNESSLQQATVAG